MKITEDKIIDSSNLDSIDVEARKLYDASGNEVLDWSTGNLPFTGAALFGDQRIVYLVNDTTDANALGSTGNKVYTTFQDAYDAANTLQQSLGGTNRVVIMVGSTTAASVGDLTLTANWNGMVSISGISPLVSELGNIIATNAGGSGYSVGTIVGSTNQFRADNIKMGNITTSPTGATGGAGSIVIQANNCTFGNLITTVPNTTNTNGGIVRVTSIGNLGSPTSNCYVTSIDTHVPDNSTNSGGTVTLIGPMLIPTITTAQATNVSSTAGGIGIVGSLGPVQVTTINFYNMSGNVSVSLTNAIVSVVNANLVSPNSISITDSSVGSLNLTGFGTSSILRSRVSTYFAEAGNSITATIKHSYVGSIWGIGDGSTLVDVTLDGTNGSGNAVIDEIGTNCELVGVNIHSSNPDTIKAIDSPTPVTIKTDNSRFNAVVGDTVTMVYKGGIVEIVEDAGTFVFDAEKSLSALVLLSGAGSNSLSLRGCAQGQKYIVYVSNGTGAETLTISSPGTGTLIKGGSYTPTPTPGAVDILEIIVGPFGDLYIIPHLNFA